MGLKSTLEKAYPRLPLAAQNTLISGQGWIFRRFRFGPPFPALFGQTVERAAWSADRLEAFQAAQLRAFVRHAYDTSPYWRRTMDAAGAHPDALRHVEDLRRFPVLEKSDLRQRTAEIASQAPALGKRYPIHTSGTTGTPISVALTQTDMQQRMAYLHRMLLHFGVAPLARSARFSGRTLFPDAERNKVFWRHNRPMNQLLMSSYNLSEANAPHYVDKLARYAPVLIDGFPSSIYVLARLILKRGEAGRIRPRAVMTTAETLEPYQRAAIAEAFGGCPVVNQYASSEGAPFITQDEHDDMVVNTDSGVFEFVRPGTEEPAAPGELAEMLVTSFTTHAYPLIRYRIGDTVLLPETPRQARSWAMPVVEQVLGRQEDILYTPARGYVGRLDPVFKKSPSTVVESQIVQTAPMAVTLRVVPDRAAGYTEADLAPVLKELRARLGEVEITVEEHAALPRGRNGKLRAVIGLSRTTEAASQATP